MIYRIAHVAILAVGGGSLGGFMGYHGLGIQEACVAGLITGITANAAASIDRLRRQS